jgi:xanthine dehydrogenase large subunit
VGTDIETALNNSARRVRGHISAGGQYHFYMEAQTAVACSVDGDNITVTCGSQYASAYQSTIAMVLGVPLNKVRRMSSFFFSRFVHGRQRTQAREDDSCPKPVYDCRRLLFVYCVIAHD